MAVVVVVVDSDLESDEEDSGEFCKFKWINSMLFFRISKRTFGDLISCLFSLMSSSISTSNCADISDGFDRKIESVRWR